MATPDVDPDLTAELLDVALQAASAAAELVHGSRPADLTVETKSSATDHVTNMDRSSEALVRRIIQRRRPADAVIGEEDGGTATDTGVTWWVDPIDGTTNYVYDHPGYAVSVAAWVDGQPVAAVVEDPTHGRTYSASRDMGAFCNGERLQLGAPPPLSQMLVATGFGYDPARRSNQGQVVASILADIRDIRRMGAAAVDLCSVAAGRVDAYYEVGLSWWDLAGGLLVAMEAGAAVEAIEGGPPRPGSVLACHPDRTAELRDLLLTAGASGL
ncbi:MAG: inositol monophosphatase [Actinomycetia bacterium]|nr:inositol monophosphatase [Actinomycetes bacterium]